MTLSFVLCGLLFCAAAASGLAQSFTMSGYLIDAATNQALSGVRLHIYNQTDASSLGGHGPAADPAISNAEGRFTFTGLSSGHYALQAETPQGLYTYGQFADPLLPGRIPVGADAEGQEVFFRIQRPGKIGGTVRGEHGEVPESAAVTYFRRARRGGRIELMLAGSTGIDDRGRYTIPGLLPGDYVVCVEPPRLGRGYFAPLEGSDVEYRPGGQSEVYTGNCHPAGNSPTTFFHVGAGTDQSLNFTLSSATGVTLQPKTNVALYRADVPRLAPVGASETSDFVAPRWQIPKVAPGSYIVYALTGDGSGFAQSPGEVVRKPILVPSQAGALDLVPQKRGKIAVYRNDPDGRPLSEEAARVFVFPFELLTLEELYGTGRWYTFDPGSYWLSVRPKPPYCAQSMTLSGGTLVNGKITVTPGMSGRLDVGLGRNCGTIEIRTGSSGAEAPFSEYLLLVNGTPTEPGDVITGATDAHGRASISRAPPGRYLLWAWRQNADGYLGPNLAAAAAEAVEVVVAGGQSVSVSIEPSRSGGFR